ncbi:unnamed protein product [Candidula unifasciata]|uniref:Protein phosphatase 1 regulatory inhibitor subunit 16B n=1 Tax=Candidula unifasciata TaxID=100452 RepID=A0A8S3Z5W7_9EUPU|nr:unnamed protein product [Candidula unifasciata]
MATEHYELVNEMASIERMTTQDRLKHAKKRRSQQLKKWNQYEKQLEKESGKKSKKKGAQQKPASTKSKRGSDRVRFVANIALLESAARNDLEEVRRLLNSSVSPDVTNEDGLTALHQCCIDDNEEMLKLLLEFGANVNACDSEMWTPLHAAATCGHATLCKLLIDRGAELLAVNADGNMPYDICEDDTTLDYIESEMAKRGITQEQIDETRLTIERQMLRDLKELASSGGDLEFRDAVGATMLHVAAANGYTEVAEFLMDQHVSVDPRDNESWQPVHAAAYWGQLDILELLVQNGADLDSKTKNGETPFDLCEEPDIKQRILDMKDEIETHKANRLRPGSSRKLKHISRNTSIRRSSLRGEKSSLFKKEAQEEAMHFGMRLMQDDEDLGVLDEEKENMPATNIDDVSTTFDEHDHRKTTGSPQLPPFSSSTNNKDHRYSDRLPDGKVNRPGQLADDRPLLTGSSGSTLTDLKKHRSDVRRDSLKDTLDAQFQKMFLETVPQINNRNSTASVTSNSTPYQHLHIYPPPMMEKAKNGHNSNSSTTSASLTRSGSTSSGPHSSFREGQLRKFVAPSNAPVVGGDEKQKCCVIS